MAHAAIDLGQHSLAVVAVILLGIGLGTLAAAPRRATNRFFAFFLALVAANFAFNYLAAYGNSVLDREPLVHVMRRLAEVVLVLDPAVLVYFASLFPRRRAFAASVGRALGLFVPAAVLMVFAVTVPAGGLGASVSPYVVAREAYLVVYYLVALGLIAEAWRLERDASRRRMMRLLTIAFAVMVLPRIGPAVQSFGVGWSPIAFVVTFGAFFVAWAYLAYMARGDPTFAREVHRTAAVTGGLVALVVATWVPAVLFDLQVGLVYSSRWVVFGALVSYAILRHQVFDIDLRLARGATVAMVGLVVAAAFFAVHTGVRMAAPTLAEPGPSFFGALVGVGITVPAFRLVKAAAAPLVPQGAEASVWLHRRKLEVYGAALATVMEEGRDPESDRELARMRKDMGLSQREHRDLRSLAEAEARIGHQAFAAFRRGALVGDRYRVADQIGGGRHARAYRAEDTRTGEPVVLKELRPEWSSDPRVRARFDQEGEILLRHDHPHLVRVRARFEAARSPCLVLDWCPGGSLRDRLQAGPLSLEEAVRFADGMLAGLDALHADGVVHRDVKPGNVLFDADGRVRLSDLGIAHAATADEELTLVTSEGAQPGTLAYMSPEQARSGEVDRSADLYAVGAVLFEMLTGRPPVEVHGLSEFEARDRVHRTRPRFAHPAVPPALAKVLKRAMAAAPTARYRRASTFREALAEALAADA